MSLPRLFVAGFFAAMVATASLPCHAGDAALAEQLFRDGLALVDQGKPVLACDKFEASMATEPSGGAALNLGRCNEEQGKTATAWAFYQRAATLFRAGREPDRHAFAAEQVARLESALIRLTITAPNVEGLEVTRNGVAVPGTALGTPLPVDPGEQVLEARAPGHETVKLVVQITADDSVTLPPLPVRAEPERAGQPGEDTGVDPLVLSGGILLGLGAVAGVAGGVIGATVLGDADRARELCGGNNSCDQSSEGREGRQLADDAKSKALIADVLVIGGATVGAAGAALLIWGLVDGDESAADSAWTLWPVATPEVAGIGFATHF
jgi:hypothetical protein